MTLAIESPRRATAEDIRLGKKIKALRMARGLTQEALGAAVGVTFQQIQKYESCTNRVSFGVMCRIAAALKVSVWALAKEAAAPLSEGSAA